MDITMLMHQLADLRPFPALEAALAFEVTTPATHFIHIVVPIKDGQAVLSVYRDGFDERWARALEKRIHEMSQMAPVGVVNRASFELGGKFDELLMLSPQGHGFWKADRPSLWSTTLVCFPIARYEIPLDASADEVRYLRERTDLNSSDWSRMPTPALYVAYENVVTQERTSSAEPRLGSFGDILRAVQSLIAKPSEQNWVRAQDWRHRDVAIAFDMRNEALLLNSHAIASSDLSAIEKGLRNLFTRGDF